MPILGLEAARHFIRLNASKVILAVRSISKGEAAAADISTSLSTAKSRIDVWHVDLSNYDSIKAFAKRVKSLDRLDAFVQNAGILTARFEVVEGQESTITINVIGAVLLGLSVLPKLQESAAKYNLQGRLTFVGSDLQYIAKFKEKDASGKVFEALKAKEGVDMDDRSVPNLVPDKCFDTPLYLISKISTHADVRYRYKVSKLLLLYATRSIAAKCPVSAKSNVVINYLTPGACKSDIFRDDIGWLQSFIQKIAVSLIARTTEVGSRALVHAVKPDVGEQAHGAFLMDCKVAQ